MKSMAEATEIAAVETPFDREPEELALLASRLRKDMELAAKAMPVEEARFVVDVYYQVQQYRLATANQCRSLKPKDATVPAPVTLLGYFLEQMRGLEKQAGRVLDVWTQQFPESVWARSICGIGPVISAGLKAHIDPSRTAHVGQLWSFAGLNPDKKWAKGQKRPWNAKLKSLVAFKVGESFVKTQFRDADVYGKLFRQRKDREIARNEAGMFAAQAAECVTRVGTQTDAYKAYSKGKLPPAHLHARARRWTVKLFLSHYWDVTQFVSKGVLPPLPYVFAHESGHTDYIQPPNMHLIVGLAEAYAARPVSLPEPDEQDVIVRFVPNTV